MSPQRSFFAHIYVDLDDVIAQTALAFLAVLEQHFHKRVAFQDVYSYDLGKSFDLQPQDLERFMSLAHEPAVLERVQPMPGAQRTLQRWHRLGAFIVVVTGRPITTFEVSERWLKQHRFPYNALRFVRKYVSHPVQSSHRRPVGLRTLAKARFDFALEDSPSMARFIANRLRIPVALLDRPWNQAVPRVRADARPLITRCDDWSQIASLFASRKILDGPPGRETAGKK